MPALDFYAPEKARISRWMLGVAAMLLAGYGAYSLYYWVPEGWRQPILGWKPLGDAFPVSGGLGAAVAMLVASTVGTWFGINHTRFVNFLHEVEVEMGKVSWASKSEVISSSMVVVAATVILAGWVFLADLVLGGIRQVLGG